MWFKLISRLKPDLSFKELLAALNLFSKGNVSRFEKQFAQKFECKYGVMFQHGRSGLYALFKIWQLNDDEIICPAYTCVVVAHAIVLSGNIPVFVDCAGNSFNMSYDGIEQAISGKTRAIIVTHLFGYPMDVFRINEIVKRAEEKYGYKIYIIQDAAHSFGCKWEGELVTKFGDAAIFGLNISKTITSIFGGMVTTNSELNYQELLNYRIINLRKSGLSKTLYRLIYLTGIYIAFNPYIYGAVNLLERKGLLNRFVKYYDDAKIYFPEDWDVWPSEIEARVGLAQLKKYENIISKRTKNALSWMDDLNNETSIRFMPHIEGATYSHCVGLVTDRNTWIEKYFKDGFQLGILIEYSIPYMNSYKKYLRTDCPVSLNYSKNSINFPLNYE